MPAADQLFLFSAAPPHPDARPLVTHIPPSYPGEIDYLWPIPCPAFQACGYLMHLDVIRHIPGGYRGCFTCPRCGDKSEARVPRGR